MTCPEVLKQLEAWGDPKGRAINAKHGAGENQFGVNLAKLRALAKQLKANHPLALELWATGNVDARLLATLLMKPKELSADELDAMMQEVSYFKIADWMITNVVRKTKLAGGMRQRWRDSKKDCVARAGWSLMTDEVVADGSLASATLDTIEKKMKQAPFRTQEAMNYCLVRIGADYPGYRQRAIDIANKLEVLKDYPVPKGCTSPFAPIWIDLLVKGK
ncbi:DNA alkylation repair protein [Luteolibacter sp. Populi]|uniref:DNA alkylation repair protein n=1 Tax=Luteolibacter sp. Populi TaxID=3230487 RepID=UPI00346708CF